MHKFIINKWCSGNGNVVGDNAIDNDEYEDIDNNVVEDDDFDDEEDDD